MTKADRTLERLIDWTQKPDNVDAGILRMLLVIAAITAAVLISVATIVITAQLITEIVK